MGKKLPKPKRHFGVRDPLKQLEERENAIKDKINNPPSKDENQQKISQKMRKFMELKAKSVEKVQQKKNKKSKKNNVGKEGQLVRRTNETEEKYLKRLNRLKNSKLTESLYAAKYNVRVKRNAETGELKVVQGEKNEIDELIAQKKKGKRVPKRREGPAKLTPLQKLKLKKKEKREKTKETDDSLPQREVIPFGERVDAPPTLVVPRKAEKNESGKPKKNRKGLLLMDVIKKNQEQIDNKLNTTEKPKVDFHKLRVEQDRQSIVQLYKEYKKKKRVSEKLSGTQLVRNEKGMSTL